MNEKILITGATGFLAGYLIKELKKNNCDIYGITDEDIPKSTDNFFKIDLRNRDELFKIIKDIKPDKVFHLAAITNVGQSWKNQKLTYEVNFIGSLNLLEALTENNLKKSRVIMMSSAEVYGKNNSKISEKTNIKIENPYSLSKYAMELLADLFIKSKDMDIIKIRAFNFTGPGQNKYFVSSDFAYQIARIEKKMAEPVIKVGNLSAKRDFSDVRDIARYIDTIGREGESGFVYNVSSGKLISIEDILKSLLSFSKTNIEIMIDKDKFRPIDIPVLQSNNSLIRKKFHLYPEYNLNQTLEDILDYWRQRINEKP